MAEVSKTPVYNWLPQKYIDLVENTANPMLSEYQQAELDYMRTRVEQPRGKVFVDVGAGYGRVLSELSRVSRSVIAVEIDEEMLGELRRRAQALPNVHVVQGDANQLSDLLKNHDMEKPVFICLQNSLGTWKGDWEKVVKEMKRIAQERRGEIFLSLFCQEGLKDFGIDMYRTAQDLVGEPDLEHTDFERGIFRSKSGYKSQWWTKGQREVIRRFLDGQKVGEVVAPAYYLLHTKYF